MSDSPSAPDHVLDGFAYRRRVADVMVGPVVTIALGATLREAAAALGAHRVSALAVTGGDGPVSGILTERDLVRAIARGVDLDRATVLQAMTADVATIAPDAFVYVAIGRMQRLGIRHLPVVDDGRLAGMVSARALLKLRAGQAPVIGDAIGAAETPQEMAESLAQLPALARAMLADGCGGHEIAAVVAGVFRDATARAVALAEARLSDSHLGPPPAAYAFLVLGSAGRGESLLRPDQDNAIVHAGTVADDGWFAELGRMASDFLDAAGIPYCIGHVMASEPHWRRTLAGWRDEIGRWIARAEGESLLNVDIFFDFQPVHGDRGLAGALRAQSLAAAARAPLFLRMMAGQLDSLSPPFNLFGRLRTDPDSGRFDAKIGALLPAVAAARIMALATETPETGTVGRLRAAAAIGGAESGAVAEIVEAHGLVLRMLAAQQVADRAAGQPATNWLAARELPRHEREALIEALHAIDGAKLLVRDVLTAPRNGSTPAAR
ncbi:MAG: DUF294 nucleotidyltransferase-like domain-containing protein [Alphaproteobacteria bacterium]